MPLPFHIVDVFAESKYSGNQLAVFENAQDLTQAEMQNIAREINFAESTFITQIDKKTNAATIRIFTPEFEKSAKVLIASLVYRFKPKCK